MNTSGTACCSGTGSKAHPKSPRGWNITYLAAMTILAVFWWLAYSRILPVAHRLVFGLLGMAPESRLGAALEFFIYDTVKILLLLAALIAGRAKLCSAAILAGICGFPACVFFALGALGMVCMCVFARRLDSSDPRANWLEQGVNALAQICIYIGLLQV